jgi:VanZ family protein
VSAQSTATPLPWSNIMIMKKILWWLPTIIYISLILTLSFKPAPNLPSLEQIDKLVHASAYAFLAFLLSLSFSRSGFSNTVILAAGMALLVGALDESLQSFNPARTASIYDFLADGVGALMGAVAGLRTVRIITRSF